MSEQRRAGFSQQQTEESGMETTAECSAITLASFHAFVQHSPACVFSWTMPCSSVRHESGEGREVLEKEQRTCKNLQPADEPASDSYFAY